MKIYKTQSEVEADIKNGVLAIWGDVKFECPISIDASIIVTNGDITARDINARDINAGNINARDITAGNITAWDINAWNITAWDITAWDISYYAFCCVYESIKCTSIKSRRQKAQEPFCLNGKLEIKPKEDEDVERAIKLLEEKGRLKDGKILS
jgi:hypothetical protein